MAMFVWDIRDAIGALFLACGVLFFGAIILAEKLKAWWNND